MAAQKNTAVVQNRDIVSNVNHATEIFFEYGDFIRTVIRHKIHDENRVEDLFQDFFVSLVSRPIPPDVRDLRSFIYKAIINDIIDRARSTERYKNLKHKYAEYLEEPVNNCTAEDAFIEKEQTDKMIELIEMRVTRSEAKAITSRYCDNLCIQEIADRMSIDGRSVSRYISTGLRKVRQFFKVKKEDSE